MLKFTIVQVSLRIVLRIEFVEPKLAMHRDIFVFESLLCREKINITLERCIRRPNHFDSMPVSILNLLCSSETTVDDYKLQLLHSQRTR